MNTVRQRAHASRTHSNSKTLLRVVWAPEDVYRQAFVRNTVNAIPFSKQRPWQKKNVTRNSVKGYTLLSDTSNLSLFFLDILYLSHFDGIIISLIRLFSWNYICYFLDIVIYQIILTLYLISCSHFILNFAKIIISHIFLASYFAQMLSTFSSHILLTL